MDARVLQCTTTFGVYGDILRPNVSYRMAPQTHLVDGASYNTGEVTIKAAHTYGGSAYQSSTANSGHIERIPRWFSFFTILAVELYGRTGAREATGSLNKPALGQEPKAEC